MREFASSYGFDPVTSSPLYPQSNGLAERTIKIVKMLRADPYMALLSFRSTPIPWCQFSPAELLMGRRNVPILKTELIPQWPYLMLSERKTKNTRMLRNRYMTNITRQDTKIHSLQSRQCGLEQGMIGQHQAISSHQPRPLDHILWRRQMEN